MKGLTEIAGLNMDGDMKGV